MLGGGGGGGIQHIFFLLSSQRKIQHLHYGIGVAYAYMTDLCGARKAKKKKIVRQFIDNWETICRGGGGGGEHNHF